MYLYKQYYKGDLCQDITRNEINMLAKFIKSEQITRNRNTNQHGVPTKVFLDRCLSPVSNIQADTPKSPSLTAPPESTRMFPAYKI